MSPVHTSSRGKQRLGADDSRDRNRALGERQSRLPVADA